MTLQLQVSTQLDTSSVLAAIRAARRYTAKRPRNSINSKTYASYSKIVERLEATRMMPHQLSLTASTRSMYSSALVTINIKRLIPLVQECERFLIGEIVKNISEKVAQINYYVDILNRLKSRLTVHTAVESAPPKCPRASTTLKNTTANDIKKRLKKTKKCKRIGLLKAPKNWQNLLLSQFRNEETTQLAIAVAEVTGCRPSELKLGIMLSFSHCGGISFYIESVKVNSGRGQPFRIINVADTSTPAFVLLRDRLDKSQTGELLVKINNAKQFSDRIRYESRKLFPHFGPGFSSYSYRHAFSSAHKAAGLSRSDLAKALGHLSACTQGTYGRKKQGRSCNKYFISSVFAPREIVNLHKYKTWHSDIIPQCTGKLTMRM